MEKRIGFGKRLGAYLLDIVIIGVLSFVIGALGGAAIFTTILGASDGGAEAGALGGALAGIMASAAGAMVISLLVYLMEAFMGVTPGKIILGLKIGNKDGGEASSSELLTRFVVKVSGTLLTILAGITGVTMLGTLGSVASLLVFVGCFMVIGSQKQALHDMVAKTAVFNKADIA